MPEYTIHIVIDGPGTSLTRPVDFPTSSVEYHGFDALEEAGHELLGLMVEDLKTEDRARDGEYTVYVR